MRGYYILLVKGLEHRYVGLSRHFLHVVKHTRNIEILSVTEIGIRKIGRDKHLEILVGEHALLSGWRHILREVLLKGFVFLLDLSE